MRAHTRRLLISLSASVLIAGILIFYFADLSSYLTFQTIKTEHLVWISYVQEHPVLSVLYFFLIYIVSVCLVIPDSTILSILAGLLFPLPLAIFYVTAAETIGAILFFLVARGTYDLFYKKYHPLKYVPKLIQAKLSSHQGQASLLLFFRLAHLLPFWVINLCAACLNVPLKTFAWTTWIGMIPLATVLVYGGSEFNHYLATHTEFSMATFLDAKTKIALAALGLLALIPLFWKRK